jgi:23S rRNA (adenine2030-N6)-methyltransferase
MNYRHAFHAGNHGDVFKHVVLTRVLSHMTKKDKPFRLLDAHAGIGRYDLSGPEAFKTGEWRDGIGLLREAQPGADECALLEPYLSIVERMNQEGSFRHYCGSPEIAARMMRPKDRIVLNELHPQDRATLTANYASDRRVRVTGVDAAQAVKAELPFAERRGVVLLDPAYESPDDSADLARMMMHIVQRMAQTVVLAWYPVKSEEFVAGLLDRMKRLNLPGLLHIQLIVKEVHEFGGLAGSGLLVLNPPWPLEEECRKLLPFLARVLGKGRWGRSTVEWLTPPL